MAKLYLNDLASVLIEKHKLTKQEASRFLTAIVEVIHDAVATDKMVKVKGLGTFKVIEVDARESVNVNTGERFVIDGHQKLTFTPDNTMKELVNKPFSQFETVILNDNVTFEDEEEEKSDPTASPDPSEGGEEEASPNPSEGGEKVPDEEEEPVQEEEPAVISSLLQNEEPAPYSPPSEGLGEAEPASYSPPSEGSGEAVGEAVGSASSSKRWPLWLGLAVLACALCFVAGYFVGQKAGQAATNEETQPADSLVTAPVVATDTARVQTDSLVQQQDTVITNQQPEANVEQQPQQQEEEDYLKYEEMDSRVRLGAYHIIGTDFIVNARPGDNTARIARRTLGAGMECYIEVYNNIDGRTKLEEGQEVKIPKLRMKENVRKKLRR